MANLSQQEDFELADTLLDHLLGFLHHMRSNGFHLGIQEELDVMKMAESGILLQQKLLRWGLRALLCSCADDWRRFDELFDAFWITPNGTREQASSYSKQMESEKGLDGGQQGGGGDEAIEADHAEEGDDNDAGEGGSKGGASVQQVTAKTDFRQLSDDSKMREMELLVERMAKKMRRRMTRRQRVQRQGNRINLRQTIRNSLRYGGTPLELAFMKRKKQAPRLILLLDVSRSMSLYSFLFLRFARGIIEAFKDSDAFVYHTRLVHVTDALRERDMTKSKEKLALMSSGWSGGTRIGECLQMFNHEYGRRIVNSRSIVMIISDGYDTGEPKQLTEQLQQLKQRARKIVWLNPLLGRDGYEPIAKGMQAALPLLDLFSSAHNLESLMKLEPELMKL